MSRYRRRNRRYPKKKKLTGEGLLSWFMTYTKKVVTLITIVWFFKSFYSACMIWYAVQSQGNFSYLDSFITDSGETFRLIVGTYLISKTIENVFKNNDGGIFGYSLTKDDNQKRQDKQEKCEDF